MANKTIRIATRKSPLALWQAEHVASKLRANWPMLQTELIPMQTTGDNFIKDRLQSIGGKGLFIKELEMALLNDQADIAVHSMKDVPTVMPEGLQLSVICKRDNPYDALISKDFKSLEELPEGSTIGTSSLRRQAQIKSYRPDIIIKILRGNIHTRILKFENGDYDGIILAASGLIRMNLEDKISEIFSDKIMLPSCGQGALGIESRAMDLDIFEYIKPLNDEITAKCVNTERYINGKLGGGCHAPIGIFCQQSNIRDFSLQVKILAPNGESELYDEQHGDINNAFDLADKSVKILMQKGAKKLLELR